ncbi:MAG: hypothetical protein CMO43_08685 [Verrucomicrobiales bacterium]|nr:hypothetical protein [Verrucomicrobiales bacterium]
MNDKIGDERRGSRQDGIFLLRLTNDHQIGQSRVRSQRLSGGTLDAAPFPLNAFLRQAALDQLAVFIFRIANRLQRFRRNIACTIRITDKDIGIPACGLQTNEEALVISHEIDRSGQAAVLSGVAIDVQQHCFHCLIPFLQPRSVRQTARSSDGVSHIRPIFFADALRSPPRDLTQKDAGRPRDLHFSALPFSMGWLPCKPSRAVPSLMEGSARS